MFEYTTNFNLVGETVSGKIRLIRALPCWAVVVRRESHGGAPLSLAAADRHEREKRRMSDRICKKVLLFMVDL